MANLCYIQHHFEYCMAMISTLLYNFTFCITVCPASQSCSNIPSVHQTMRSSVAWGTTLHCLITLTRLVHVYLFLAWIGDCCQSREDWERSHCGEVYRCSEAEWTQVLQFRLFCLVLFRGHLHCMLQWKLYCLVLSSHCWLLILRVWLSGLRHLV